VFEISENDIRALGHLLTPSWLSGLITAVIALALSVGVVLIFSLHGSGFQQDLIILQQSTAAHASSTNSSQIIVENNNLTFGNTWPLMIIWGFVGLLTYMIVAGLSHFFKTFHDMEKSLSYAHTDATSIIHETIERVTLRLTAFIILGFLVDLFIKKVIPYSVSAALASANNLLNLDSLLYIFLSLAVSLISVHILIILFRLSLGRIRAFTKISL
jgi:hypothetical protein